MNMQSNKILHIKGYSQKEDIWLDFEPIIEKFPNLQTLRFYTKDKRTFDYVNEVYPIF